MTIFFIGKHQRQRNFYEYFPGAKHFNISGNFPDTSNDDIYNVVRKVIFFLLKAVLFSERFQNDKRKLITENILLQYYQEI